MLEVTEILIAWAVAMTSIGAVLESDRRSFCAAGIQPAWPQSTVLSAMLFSFMMSAVLGPLLAFTIYFARSRSTLKGILFGLALTAMTVLQIVALAGVVELAFGEPEI